MGAFVVSAGVDFLSNWIFDGQDYKTAFNNISWSSATIDGLSTAALSFFIDGTGTSRTMLKIGKSKAGRFAIDVGQTMMLNIVNRVSKGESFDEIDLTEEFIFATFQTLLSKKMSKRADELLSSLKESNQRLYYALEKLNRNIKAGKHKPRIKADTQKLNIAKENVKRNAINYAKKTTENRFKTSLITTAARNGYEKNDKKIKR